MVTTHIYTYLDVPDTRVPMCRFVLVKDCPLLWILVRSQTYYPEHILAYRSGKARYALVVGSGSFLTD